MMRKYLIGIMIGIALTISATSFADNIESLIGKKVQSEYPVTINGEKLSKQAVVINDSSYLPVRTIGDALNLDVSFNEKAGIGLKSKETAPMSETAAIPASQGLTKKYLDVQISSQFSTIAGALYWPNSSATIEKAKAEISKLEQQETPLQSGYSVDELNKAINNIKTTINTYQTELDSGKTSDKYSADILVNIEDFIQILKDKLDALEAQKAELYPDTTPTPVP